MAYDGSIKLPFGGGKLTFRLALGELQELEEVCGDRRPDGSIRRVGPNVILTRLRTGDWTTADVMETIRLGLIGGGMVPHEAQTMVERYVTARPDWRRNSIVAMGALDAALEEPDEDLGELGAVGEREAMNFPTAESPLPPSTETPEP